MFIKILKNIASLYLVIFFILYAGGAEWWLYQNFSIGMDPVFVFIIIIAPIAVICFFLIVMKRHRLSAVELVFTKSFYILLFFGALAIYSLVRSGFEIPLEWQYGGKHQFAPFVNFFIFLLFLAIFTILGLYSEWRKYCLIAFLVLGLSIIIDAWFPGLINKIVWFRAEGLAGQPNKAALSLVFLLCCLLQYKRLKYTDLILLFLCAFGVLLTLSRMGTIILLVAGVFYFFSLMRSVKNPVLSQTKILLEISIFLFLLIYIISLTKDFSLPFSTDRGLNRYDILTGEAPILSDPSTQTRYILLREGVNLFLLSPILGHGTGFNRSLSIGVHNEYLRHAIDGGCVGLILYLFFLLSIFIFFYKRDFYPGISFIFIFSIIGFASHNLLDNRNCLLILSLLCIQACFISRKDLNS